MPPKYWKKACAELSAKDPVLAKIIKNYKGEFLQSRGHAFTTLLRSIVGQQISVKAAQTIWSRLLEHHPEKQKAMPHPEWLKTISTEQFRACGFSLRKSEYALDLATHFLSDKINPELWPKMSDEEIIEQLTEVRGIGRWTAEMFLMFHLLRPNVFPKDDMGLHKALSVQYKTKYPLSKPNLAKFERKFSPWGSVATWYLWRSLDPISEEY